MTEFVSRLAAFRRAHPCLRQTRFLHAAARPQDGLPDVEWLGFDGNPLNWRDPGLSALCLLLRICAETPEHLAAEDCVFAIINCTDQKAEVILPSAPAGKVWELGFDTSAKLAEGTLAKGKLAVSGESVVALILAEREQDA
jgi:glycogen operon protein